LNLDKKKCKQDKKKFQKRSKMYLISQKLYVIFKITLDEEFILQC